MFYKQQLGDCRNSSLQAVCVMTYDLVVTGNYTYGVMTNVTAVRSFGSRRATRTNNLIIIVYQLVCD